MDRRILWSLETLGSSEIVEGLVGLRSPKIGKRPVGTLTADEKVSQSSLM